MNEISYAEVKELTIEDFNDFINEEGFTAEQAIAATFEDSVIMMQKSRIAYVSVIVNLSILSMNQNFIPDFLLERQESITRLDDLSEEDKIMYNEDIFNLRKLLENQEYRIEKDEQYRLRVNMLLNE